MSNRAIWETEFEDLFKKNYSRLFYCALDWVEDSEVAKDIVSELFSEIRSQNPQLIASTMEQFSANPCHL